MLFNSIQFAIFFPIVTLLFFILPHKYRNLFLLAASSYFYMAFVPQYILIILTLNIIDFFAAQLIDKKEGKKRKIFLIISITVNILFLSYYKYLNFLNDSFRYIAELIQVNYPIPHLDILLPIGLSFHTLQSLGYVIDVYRRQQPVERNFIKYNLYVMFYPQLVAGPIERARNLLPQMDIVKKFNLPRVMSGLQLMAIGFYKKVIIADTLAIIVNQTFKNPTQFSGPELWIGAFAFSFQVYCDFSGYTDIGRGAARVMGFELMENFLQPLHSQSYTEFWRRWHISLSSWLKDYVYVPILKAWSFTYVKILAAIFTFTMSGLWHGASWNFVIWGFLNGAIVAVTRATEKYRENSFISRFKYLNIFVVNLTFALTCVIFRTNSMSLATDYYKGLFLRWNEFDSSKFDVEGTKVAIVCFFLLIALETIHLLQNKPQLLQINHRIKRWSLHYALGLFFVILGYLSIQLSSRSHYPFVYFQF